MGENICKWSKWQRINLQNLQAAPSSLWVKSLSLLSFYYLLPGALLSTAPLIRLIDRRRPSCSLVWSLVPCPGCTSAEKGNTFVGKRVCSRLALPESSFYLHHLLALGLGTNKVNCAVMSSFIYFLSPSTAWCCPRASSWVTVSLPGHMCKALGAGLGMSGRTIPAHLQNLLVWLQKDFSKLHLFLAICSSGLQLSNLLEWSFPMFGWRTTALESAWKSEFSAVWLKSENTQ